MLAGTILIFSVIFMYDCSIAQKIRVVDRPKKQYAGTVPAFSAHLDTLHILIKITRVGVVRLQQYSAVNLTDLPADFAILLQNQIGRKIDWQKDGRLLLYHFNITGRPARSIRQYLMRNNGYQKWLLNPFLNEAGENKYHILLLEIRNWRTQTIRFEPFDISMELKSGERRFVLQPEQILNSTDSRNYVLSEKILRENLFMWQHIAPQQSVAGLVCFPLKNRNEKIVKVILKKINCFSSDGLPEYFSVVLRANSKLLIRKK